MVYLQDQLVANLDGPKGFDTPSNSYWLVCARGQTGICYFCYFKMSTRILPMRSSGFHHFGKIDDNTYLTEKFPP